MRYAVVIEKGERNYSAYVPDLPGCVSVGDTAEEVKLEIREAIEFHLEGMREDGLPIPKPSARRTMSRSESRPRRNWCRPEASRSARERLCLPSLPRMRQLHRGATAPASITTPAAARRGVRDVPVPIQEHGLSRTE